MCGKARCEVVGMLFGALHARGRDDTGTWAKAACRLSEETGLYDRDLCLSKV